MWVLALNPSLAIIVVCASVRVFFWVSDSDEGTLCTSVSGEGWS